MSYATLAGIENGDQNSTTRILGFLKSKSQ